MGKGIYLTPYIPTIIGTVDAYEVGDLSGKYGTTFNAKTSTFNDYNLPLFGTNSILLRSFAIRRNASDSSTSTCVNIHPDSASIKLTASAQFHDILNGTVDFVSFIHVCLHLVKGSVTHLYINSDTLISL